MKKKILFTGGSGLLAINWALSISHDFEVILGMHERHISLPGISSIRLSIDSVEAMSMALKNIRPDVVIHCAGLANVELCEADPELAHRVNVNLSVNVAQCCKEQNIQLVYISTDHLFSGHNPMVTEKEVPSPVNVYGKTKLEAEQRILDIADTNLSIRTNFYGWGPSYRQSFSDMIIQNNRNGKAVFLFDDFFYTPILIAELARSVMSLLHLEAKGIFNVTGNERISKYEFGSRLVKRFGLNGSLVNASKFSDRKDLVKRPGDLSLSNKKLVTFLNRPVGDINENIQRLYRQEQDGFSTIIRNL